MHVAYPIPAPAGTPAWVGALLVAGGFVVFGVVLWQTVRYFRDHRDDE